MSNRFECLPNEILPEIFIYFDLSNLYKSFWGLNQRINNIVRSLKHYSLIIEKDNLSLIELYASQIVRIKINTPVPIDLSQCSNLISLELCQANKIQIEQIRSDLMPNLVSLTISTTHLISLPMELVEEIFSNSFRKLRYAHLSRLDMSDQFPKFQSTSLHTLSVVCTNVNVIPFILQACPNLFSLCVRFFGVNHYLAIPWKTVFNHPLEKFSIDDPYNMLSFDTVTRILLFVTNVKHLFLRFLCRVPFINLIEHILNCFKQLETFECEILEMPNDNMVNIEIIQQMNECFQYLQCIERNGSREFSTESF